MVQYRPFRNDDPPGLVEIWNEAFTGRGAVVLRHSAPLERHTFAKPYFDPEGLIVAEQDGALVGFVHAGFGPNATETALAFATGIVCLIAVRPSHQHRGIASELLAQAEAYLRRRGARAIIAGCMRPLAPFYFGLYGGSDLPGFLDTDKAAGAFLEYHGYRPWDTALVFQRRLDVPINVVDGRFAGLRRRFVVRPSPRTSIGTWWQECVLGAVESVEFRLEESLTGQPVARAEMWEMEGFSWRWGLPAVGMIDLVVEEKLRRQGLAKFLLASILHYLQDQYFGLVEAQTRERNQAAVKLYQALGFEQVDFGRVYRREVEGSPSEPQPPG